MERGLQHLVVEVRQLAAVELPSVWPVCEKGELHILELDFNSENGFRKLRSREFCLVVPHGWTFDTAAQKPHLPLCDIVDSEYMEESFTVKGCMWYNTTIMFPWRSDIGDPDGVSHGGLGCNDRLVGVDHDEKPVVASNHDGVWKVLGKDFEACPKKVLFDHEGAPIFCFSEKIVRSSLTGQRTELRAGRKGHDVEENFTIDYPSRELTSSRIMMWHRGEVSVYYAHNFTKSMGFHLSKG